MRKWIVIALVAAGFYHFMKKSSPSRVREANFQGTYLIRRESGISNSGPEVERVELAVDKGRFAAHFLSTDERGGARESWRVYDGDVVHVKSLYHPSPADVARGYGGESAPSVSSHKPTDQELHLARFWSRSFPGDAGPGGKIAGRDTTLYQVRSNMPDSTNTMQAWVDAETGIVLKSVESIYAKQVEELLHKDTVECQSVRFGPVDEAAFRKPQ